jgi:hypothetical protein
MQGTVRSDQIGRAPRCVGRVIYTAGATDATDSDYVSACALILNQHVFLHILGNGKVCSVIWVGPNRAQAQPTSTKLFASSFPQGLINPISFRSLAWPPSLAAHPLARRRMWKLLPQPPTPRLTRSKDGFFSLPEHLAQTDRSWRCRASDLDGRPPARGVRRRGWPSGG